MQGKRSDLYRAGRRSLPVNGRIKQRQAKAKASIMRIRFKTNTVNDNGQAVTSLGSGLGSRSTCLCRDLYPRRCREPQNKIHGYDLDVRIHSNEWRAHKHNLTLFLLLFLFLFLFLFQPFFRLQYETQSSPPSPNTSSKSNLSSNCAFPPLVHSKGLILIHIPPRFRSLWICCNVEIMSWEVSTKNSVTTRSDSCLDPCHRKSLSTSWNLSPKRGRASRKAIPLSKIFMTSGVREPIRMRVYRTLVGILNGLRKIRIACPES